MKIYISEFLSKTNRGKPIAAKLRQILGDSLVEIPGKKNEWCRDYMPVKSGSGKYLQFTYRPSYMVDKKYANMFPNPEALHSVIGIGCITSGIILDGGAVEIHGKKGIVSDRVFRDNSSKTPAEIYKDLKTVLELEQLVVVPQYPYDFTGHVDGIVRFIDSNKVVVNDPDQELKAISTEKNKYKKKLIENWIHSFQGALLSAGFEIHYLPTSVPENSPYSSGEGIYVNFLLLPDLIFMPAYNNDTDIVAATKLHELYEIPVETIDATEISKKGGMINCVTWTK